MAGYYKLIDNHHKPDNYTLIDLQTGLQLQCLIQMHPCLSRDWIWRINHRLFFFKFRRLHVNILLRWWYSINCLMGHFITKFVLEEATMRSSYSGTTLTITVFLCPLIALAITVFLCALIDLTITVFLCV